MLPGWTESAPEGSGVHAATSGDLIWAYRALDARGHLRKGTLTGFSRAAVLESLHRQGLQPVEISESSGERTRGRKSLKLSFHWRCNAKADARELLQLTQSLASLLTAGLMVDRALQSARLLAGSVASGTLIDNLLSAVRSGATLAEAFARSGQQLPPYYLSMIEAGELGGALPESLTHLAELQRQHLGLRERVRAALIYPILLSSVLLITLTVLLAFVLPRFETLFAESQATLPLATRVVLGVGRFVADHGWVLAIGAALGIAVIYLGLRTPTGRERLDRWVLGSRWTFGLPLTLNTARLLRTLGTLCQSGVPLPTALKVARGTLSNMYMVRALQAVTRDVLAGEALSAALFKVKVFPPIAVQLARVGEETGRFEPLLLSAAAVLEEEAQWTLARLLAIGVPLLTIVMGAMVAGLIGSVLLGLLSLNDLAM